MSGDLVMIADGGTLWLNRCVGPKGSRWRLQLEAVSRTSSTIVSLDPDAVGALLESLEEARQDLVGSLESSENCHSRRGGSDPKKPNDSAHLQPERPAGQGPGEELQMTDKVDAQREPLPAKPSFYKDLNPRYVLWCRAHGYYPREMTLRNGCPRRVPDGRGRVLPWTVVFMFWIEDRWRQWSEELGYANRREALLGGHTVEEFDRWLEEKVEAACIGG